MRIGRKEAARNPPGTAEGGKGAAEEGAAAGVTEGTKTPGGGTCSPELQPENPEGADAAVIDDATAGANCLGGIRW